MAMHLGIKEGPLTTPLNWHCHCLVMRAAQRHKENLHITKMMVMCQRSDKPWMWSQKAHARTQLGTKGPKKNHQMLMLMHLRHLTCIIYVMTLNYPVHSGPHYITSNIGSDPHRTHVTYCGVPGA
jgi:hypothetical protein